MADDPGPGYSGRHRASRSPVAGELGLPIHPWVRLNHVALGLPLPTVMFDVAELREAGYDPAQLGLVRVGDQGGDFEIPVASVDVEMRSRSDIDVYEIERPDVNRPARIIGGAFGQPHPEDWWELVHEERELCLIAGDTPSLVRTVESGRPVDLALLLAPAFIGRARGLVVRADSSGIATAMP